MEALSNFLVGLVAGLHFIFLVLEMFFWQKPLGIKAFRNTPEKAKTTAVLAANQGLYNGFLAVGLGVGLCATNPEVAFGFKFYFLLCVAIAGIYGGWSANKNIFFIQSLPAIAALITLILSTATP